MHIWLTLAAKFRGSLHIGSILARTIKRWLSNWKH